MPAPASLAQANARAGTGAVSARGQVEGLASPRPIAAGLPALLQEDDFCLRLTGAFDQVLAPVFSTIDCLDSYLDPSLAPGDFVEWLASWVGVEIDQTWSPETLRQLVQEAVVLYRIRGTAAGLAAHVALYAGATPELEESGGCSWSETPGSPLPGSPEAHLLVRLVVGDPSALNRATVERIVAASRPAHLPFTIEIVGPGGDGAPGEGQPA